MGRGKEASIQELLGTPAAFCQRAGGLRLRSYQEEVMRAVIDSVENGRGLSFVVLFPRQSGKNELQAQIEALLLYMHQREPAEMVKISPTWKPQSLNAMRRLERALKRNRLTRGRWSKESGYIYRVGGARMLFFSGAPEAHIVGATASTLLEVDEAQDVRIDKFDRDIAPMAASTNATRVFYGTAWTSQTLLARELRAALEAERQDGIRRAFRIDADAVAAEVPAYGQYVAGQVARLGRRHPMVMTQYYCEEIDAQCGMFPPERLALMQGLHPAQAAPAADELYALLVDVGGEDALGVAVPLPGLEELANPRRDSTALTVVQVDLATCADPLLGKPTYRTVWRRTWQGAGHAALYAQLRALVETWQPRHLVVDATGVGAGLAGFLAAAYRPRVIPFIFNAASKTRLGWGFLEIIEAGRYKEYAGAPGDGQLERLRDQFFEQCAFCGLEVLPGPERRLRWGVPDGARHPASGELLHDDLVISAALCAVLDGLPWQTGGPGLMVPGRDPLPDLDGGW